jgi:hypothetical protein
MKPRERLGRPDRISIELKNCFEVLESMAFGTRGTGLWKEHLLPTYINSRWSQFPWVRTTTAKFGLSIQSNAHINQQARPKDKWMLENRILRRGKILIPAWQAENYPGRGSGLVPRSPPGIIHLLGTHQARASRIEPFSMRIYCTAIRESRSD